MWSDRFTQLALVVLAVAALAGAALLQEPIQAQRQELGLIIVSQDQVLVKYPKTALMQVAPGGLRAPFLTYLWIRSQEMKNQGKFFDAKQQRDLICDLMPHFPGALLYHAWDMAYNISVATHTPQERWMWVYNGISLLRDKGIVNNPKDLVLYRELAMTIFAKMGETTDEMHRVYKQRWAYEFHRLLGGLPATDETRDVIEAFRRVAAAPARPQELLSNPAVADYVARLRRLDVELDGSFIAAYNRFSGDVLVSAPAWAGDRPANPREEAVVELMRDEKFAGPRGRVLSFVRRKLLRTQFRMDAAYMLELMEKYGPLDWRHVMSHALYWASLGLRESGVTDMDDINALNASRIVLNALKSLSLTGSLFYLPGERDPEEPVLDWAPDWRFIESTHQAHLDYGRMCVKSLAPDKLGDEENMLRDGHMTWLGNIITLMWGSGRHDLAATYYQAIKDNYHPEAPVFKLPLDQFVMQKYAGEGSLTKDVWRSFQFNAFRSAYRALAAGDEAGYARHMDWARQSYENFRKDIGSAPRSRPELPFEDEDRQFLVAVFVQPQRVGLYLPTFIKSRLYNLLPMQKRLGVWVMVVDPLREECQKGGFDFEKAFPPPPGVGPTSRPR